ncbi:MAG: hypothetical protein A3H97_04065 [Acidobacteria bacterium RIFCSPLOWO2_02_FULL_65_29]|nr:MAG: hypothetical protein A3H97_04065 [Acidobacteria bacterium RIFCSPLOWO2_02_FULL_65_29]
MAIGGVESERMMNAIVAKVEAIAGEIAGTRHGRSFGHAVDQFIEVLGSVPDRGPGDLSAADIARLRDLAEGVIQLIELRLESDDDRQSRQRDLAGGVYKIRKQIEQIELWRRHYGR